MIVVEARKIETKTVYIGYDGRHHETEAAARLTFDVAELTSILDDSGRSRRDMDYEFDTSAAVEALYRNKERVIAILSNTP